MAIDTKLTKENETAVVSMMRDVAGPVVTELIAESMAANREAQEKEAKTGVPAMLQQILDKLAKGEIDDTDENAKTYDLIERDGMQIVKGRGINDADPISRLVTAIAAGASMPRIGPMGWYKDRYGEDDVLKALAATDAVAGGTLIPEAQSASLIELLRPASIFRQMNPVIEPMEGGKLTLPGLATGSAATYIGENSNIGATEPTFRDVILVAKKLAALVPISNDLIRRQSGTSPIVRDDLVNAIATKSDTVFIRSDGTEGEPKGLRFHAGNTNTMTNNGSAVTENVMADLGTVMLDLMNNNSRMIRPGWMMAPRTWMAIMLMSDANGNFFMRAEIAGGTLFGFPIGRSTNIPINLAVTGSADSELYLADFADVVIGESTTLILDASTEAAYHDGSNVQAAFSLDQTVLRAIIEHDLVVRHANSISVITDVDWAPGITT